MGTPDGRCAGAAAGRGTAVLELSGVYRQVYGRAVAVLTRLLGDIDLAEEAVQDAFAKAAARWPADGVPPEPAGWIITTARNGAIDRLRRESRRTAREAEALALAATGPPREEGPVHDDRLRLIFTCCHPSLSPAAQIALTLRLLGGLGTPQIAAAFLVPEATMAQRIVRAKSKIREAGIPYRVPREADLPQRLPPVLKVLYLIFNEGYAARHGTALTRDDLCDEAIRLTRLLAALMPDEPEVTGLLALLVLLHARRPARTGPDGALVPLPEQDRTRWDAALITEGQTLVRHLVRRGQPGPYQLQAAINAVHSAAPTARDTDWPAVLTLYDGLMAVAPTPVVALNRAVVVAEISGPAAALPLVEPLNLPGYYLWHAVRADLLRRLGRTAEALRAYDNALSLTGNEAERTHLRTRRDLTSRAYPGHP